MLSFKPSLSQNSDAFAIFVNEKNEYEDSKDILSKDIRKKIDSFLKTLKSKNQKEEISSFDISDKMKCFIIKVKSNTEEKDILEKIKEDEKVAKNLENKVIFKHIYVKNRLINLIIK